MTTTESFYSALKLHRESQKIEIAEICEFTKINKKYIDAIENGDFDVLPSVYMRLFIRAYTNFIGSDENRFSVNIFLATKPPVFSSNFVDILSSPTPKTSISISVLSETDNVILSDIPSIAIAKQSNPEPKLALEAGPDRDKWEFFTFVKD